MYYLPTLDFCHSRNSWKPPFLGKNFPLFGNTVVRQLLIFSDVTENSSFVIQNSAARTVYDAKFYIFYRSSLQDLQEGQRTIIVHIAAATTTAPPLDVYLNSRKIYYLNVHYCSTALFLPFRIWTPRHNLYANVPLGANPMGLPALLGSPFYWNRPGLGCVVVLWHYV